MICEIGITVLVLLVSGLFGCGNSREYKVDDIALINKMCIRDRRYKGACIMEDSSGKDAIVLTLDFTNNSKENASYLWSVSETVMQNGVELEVASVITDYETFDVVTNNQFKEIEPGATLEVQTAFVLADTTSTVKATFEQMLGKKNGTITIEPSTLSREKAANTDLETTSPDDTDDELLSWWNGEWYGWWKMTGCTGDYETEGMEGQWWDVCGVIDIGTDYTGTLTSWDLSLIHILVCRLRLHDIVQAVFLCQL